ncbi:MAG TPA: aconitate hydratase AcnA, partial [Myxococcota bacterium]|nr:aconitate hydratase AcnA [Myxococcota bacterium]
MAGLDPFGARARIQTPLGERVVYRLDAVLDAAQAAAMPLSIKVLLEACLRNLDGFAIEESHVKALAGYDARRVGEIEIPFLPGRVVLQDFTGVPAVVDLAAMRAGIVRLSSDEGAAKRVNPVVPCDLVVDHSVQVDAFASRDALRINAAKEFERNRERYELLKWAQQAFDNFRVVPPATGIVHQVNLEYLAKVVWDGADPAGNARALYPDSCVGTDSHTTMINGLGVLGWGVGGIEAEAVMLGQPMYMLIPEVVGLELTGRLPEGATATDLVLRVTELLRAHGVVGRFVEFFGPGLDDMPLANRATIANMAPEYGATTGFFPVDAQTLHYLEQSGRDPSLVAAVEAYAKLQGLWRDPARPPVFSETLRLDLASVVPSLAGPRRPQDRVALTDMKRSWRAELAKGFGQKAPAASVDVAMGGERFRLEHGSVVIAAITSCTNTSNPEVMLAAGLVARKARARGLTRRPWVKTSLAPGSKVVTEYYRRSGLLEDLEALGFHVVGYGCTTCIGNSGPLPDEVSR